MCCSQNTQTQKKELKKNKNIKNDKWGGKY